MALSTSQILAAGVSLILTASPAWPQSGEKLPAEMHSIGPADPGLSVECTVPDGQLFALAPLRTVKAALNEKRPVKVLTLGSPAMSALGSGTASYLAWLEHESDPSSAKDYAVQNAVRAGPLLTRGCALTNPPAALSQQGAALTCTNADFYNCYPWGAAFCTLSAARLASAAPATAVEASSRAWRMC